jgi:putative MATE family efflux protein
MLGTLLKLAVPTVTVMVAQTGVNIAEAYYVGLLGTDALAGVAMVFPVYMLMTMMSAGGFGSGVASAVARAVGAGQTEDAISLVFHAALLAVVMGAVFTVMTLVFGPVLYSSMGGSGGALAAALQYSGWLFAGAIPLWVVNLLAAALRGSGNVRLPALVTLGGAAVLVPLSPLLIFGLGPIPGLGIAGAGIAFAIYYSGAALVLIRTMRAGNGSLALRPSRLRLDLLRNILGVGLPTAFSTVVINLTVILVTGIFGAFGTDTLAGFGAASRLDYILVPLLFGLASAVLTIVGVNLGAGQGKRARHAAIVGGLVGFAMTQLIGVVVAIRPQLWLGLYSDIPEVLRAGSTYLSTVGPFYGVFGFGFVIAFAGQGAGRVFWPVTGVIARLTIAAGLGWVEVFRFGAGLAPLSWTVAVAFVAYAAIGSLVLTQRSIWAPVSR